MSQHQDRRQLWRAHLGRCREFGITLKAYVEQEGLTVLVFYIEQAAQARGIRRGVGWLHRRLTRHHDARFTLVLRAAG